MYNVLSCQCAPESDSLISRLRWLQKNSPMFHVVPWELFPRNLKIQVLYFDSFDSIGTYHSISFHNSVTKTDTPQLPPNIHIHRSNQAMTYYISITGLRLKSWFHFFRFTSYTMPAMSQAKAAKGNVYADGTYMDGVFHTLSVWEDRSSMTKFMASGAHVKAMKIDHEVSRETRIFGYEGDKIPSWEEARAIWETNAKLHVPRRKGTVQPTKRTYLRSLNGTNLIFAGILLVASIAWSGYVSQHGVTANWLRYNVKIPIDINSLRKIDCLTFVLIGSKKFKNKSLHVALKFWYVVIRKRITVEPMKFHWCITCCRRKQKTHIFS